METKTVSLIVPVFNMADYLPLQWDSLVQSQALSKLAEVILVNDGSTDGTDGVIKAMASRSPQLKYVSLPSNEGRFVARLKGAEAASGTHLLFLDARTFVSESFVQSLFSLLQSHQALMGMVHIDASKSVYNLYWQRTHEWIFRKHFADVKKGFYLTAENYESYAKGTTVFLCPRKDFLDACAKYSGRDLHSDDTLLMREIVQHTPIWVEQSLSVEWEPRQTYMSFVRRLWERGPQFAEYHVFERKGLMFALFMVWCFLIVSTLSVIALHPIMGLMILLSEFLTLALSTILFSRSPVEFIRMVPVHVGAILAYGLGAIYGVGVVAGLFKRPAAIGAKSS